MLCATWLSTASALRGGTSGPVEKRPRAAKPKASEFNKDKQPRRTSRFPRLHASPFPLYPLHLANSLEVWTVSCLLPIFFLLRLNAIIGTSRSSLCRAGLLFSLMTNCSDRGVTTLSNAHFKDIVVPMIELTYDSNFGRRATFVS